MDLQAGTRIGEYTLETYLGGGSFGAVWRGSNAAGESVAIKMLTGALSSADTAGMRANVEMLAAAAVASRSEHVVKVLGGGSEPLPHIVMEYVEGMDLATLLNDGSLPIARCIDVGLAIMEALAALNEAGIFHRDIKPANVMIDSRGVIKLADFGIAKIVGYDSITMTGQAAMTMAYAAPEVWDEDSAFGRPSHRSDLYAAGIVLYQCLAGATPFRGNYGALYKAHAERPADLSLLPAETPASLRMVIGRCLEKRQDDRPRDAGECLAMLKRAAVELRDRSGSLAAGEPRRFGPWRRETPHPTQPWAWRCRHETTGESATVEVHFVETLPQGTELKRIVDANERLSRFGAERLLGSNRLLLAPGEGWQAAPAGQFQFWVARADDAPAPAKLLDVASLKKAVQSVANLVLTAGHERVSLSIKDSLVVAQDGAINLGRPGLQASNEFATDAAFAALRTLPLSAEARAFLETARDFHEIARLSADEEQSTCVVPTAASAATAIDEPRTSVPRPEATLPVQMRMRRLSATPSSAEYELLFTNPGPGTVSLLLQATSQADSLRLSLPQSVLLPPGSQERVSFSVSLMAKRMFGGKSRHGFSVSASSGDGDRGQPPLTAEGEFEYEPSRMPVLAGGGLFGIAALAVVALLALSGGGGGATPAPADPTATATATATPTETPMPPTPTPEPEPPTPTPEPQPVVQPTSTPRPAIITPPTSTPRPAIVTPPTSTPVPYVPPTAAPPPTQAPPPPTATVCVNNNQQVIVDIVGPGFSNSSQCR